jgi:hypothetical protein
VPEVLQLGPLFPFEKAGKMPEAIQALTVAWYHGSPPPPPHELLTMCGLRSGRGFWPARFVGARIHCPEASRAEFEHELDSHPFAAMKRARGATPIWFTAPVSSPTIVPIVCVPCPLLSHGTSDGVPHTLEGSNQL